jgi:hypothetical protein
MLARGRLRPMPARRWINNHPILACRLDAGGVVVSGAACRGPGCHPPESDRTKAAHSLAGARPVRAAPLSADGSARVGRWTSSRLGPRSPRAQAGDVAGRPSGKSAMRAVYPPRPKS